MVAVNLTIPRLQSTTNIHSIRTDRPHQMPRISFSHPLLLLLFRRGRRPSFLATCPPHQKKKCHGCREPKKQILNRSTQNVMGHPPATSDPILRCWLSISGGYTSKDDSCIYQNSPRFLGFIRRCNFKLNTTTTGRERGKKNDITKKKRNSITIDRVNLMGE